VTTVLTARDTTVQRTAVFLLYLNDKTFLHAAGKTLAEELRTVRAEGSTVQVIMVHENENARGGCDFGIFFDGRTPQDLLQGGLFKALALALYPGVFWPVSAALVANVMGATAGTGFTTASATRSAVGQEAANTAPCRRHRSTSTSTSSLSGMPPTTAAA